MGKKDYKKTSAGTGCKLWEDCSTCPFPVELNCSPIKIRLYLRRVSVKNLDKVGFSVQEIANHLSLSIRTIERDLEQTYQL